MKPERAALIRDSWARVVPRADEIMQVFYARLFELEPEAQGMFAGVDMAAQRRKFVDMLATLVRVIEDSADVVMEVGPAAKRHATYGVTDRHLEAGREALLDAFQESLGDAFPAEVRQAWGELYDLTSGVMRRAGHRGVAANT